ncbi:hypothetical protein K2Y11_12030 [bacterium]|nr:hypothetical protein [bacterium]
MKWTNLSRRQIAGRMTALGTPVGRDVVYQLLHKQGYRRRQALKKKSMGQHHNQNAHFENIARIKKKILGRGITFDQNLHEKEGFARQFSSCMSNLYTREDSDL